jgi:hypothetical protein
MANEFKVKKGLIVDGIDTVLDIQGTLGQLFSVTDSLTGDLFSVSDISGVPILSVNSVGKVDIDGNLNLLNDNDKIQLGDSQDLQLYHNGTNSFIKDNGTGGLFINANGANRVSIVSDVHILGGTDFAIAAGRKLYLDGQSDTYITESSADNIKFFAGGAEVLKLVSSSANVFSNEVNIGDIIDGPFTALRLMNQKTYGSGTGTNEKVRFVMGISESGYNYDTREGFAIELGIAHESDSSDGVVDFKVRDGGTLGTYSTVTGSNKSVSFVGDLTANNLSGTNTGDQTLPTAASLGVVTLAGTQTITGVKTFNPAVSLGATLADSKYSNVTIQGVKTHRFSIDGLDDHTVELTCPSYFQAMVTITAHQTNGGTENNLYIRGIWSNNHTTHHWRMIENIGGLSTSSFSIVNGQNGSNTTSGKLTISHNYTSASFALLAITVEEHFGVMGTYTITEGTP